MLSFIFVILILSSVFGSRRSTGGMWRGFFACVAFFFGLRFLFYTGMHLLPMILMIWVVINIVVPFAKGFMSRMHR